MKGAWQIGIFCMSMMAISGYGCKSHAPGDAPEALEPATGANATDKKIQFQPDYLRLLKIN